MIAVKSPWVASGARCWLSCTILTLGVSMGCAAASPAWNVEDAPQRTAPTASIRIPDGAAPESAPLASRPDLVWIHSDAAGVFFSKTEITVVQYRQCRDAGVCEPPSAYPEDDCAPLNGGHDTHPINCVDANAAKAFCSWVGGRVPTEQEWTAEATAGGRRRWPWGDSPTVPDCAHAILEEEPEAPGCGTRSTAPVCSRTAGNSISGICDMIGNVMEWTQTNFASRYRPLYGGAWDQRTESVHAPNVEELRYADTTEGNRRYGIRCVRRSLDVAESSTLSPKAMAACRRLQALRSATDAQQAVRLSELVGTGGLDSMRQLAKDRAARESDPGRVQAWAKLLEQMAVDPRKAEWAGGYSNCEIDEATLARRAQAALYLVEGEPDDGIRDEQQNLPSVDVGLCWPFADGALGIVANPVPCTKQLEAAWRFRDEKPPFDVAVTTDATIATLVYMPAEGAPSHVALGSFSAVLGKVELRNAFDLDSDGHSDALLLALDYTSEEDTGEWTKLVRFDGGRISPWVFPKSVDSRFQFRALMDVTHDGRPDLVLTNPTYGSACGSGFDWGVSTPTIAGESKPDGSFDFDSPGARQYLQEQCPKRPTTFRTAQAVACGRAWGMTRAELLAHIRKTVKPGCRNESDEFDVVPALDSAASFQFPVRLDRAPGAR